MTVSPALERARQGRSSGFNDAPASPVDGASNLTSNQIRRQFTGSTMGAQLGWLNSTAEAAPLPQAVDEVTAQTEPTTSSRAVLPASSPSAQSAGVR